MKDEDYILSMHRSTTLQRAGFSIVAAILLAYFSHINLVNYDDPATIMAYVSIAVVALVVFLISNSLPNTQIFFDTVKGELRYYRFLLFRKVIPLPEIISIEGQTKTERWYTKGKSRTIYLTDVFVITSTGDFQINVWERAKLGEFKTKFVFAKQKLALKENG